MTNEERTKAEFRSIMGALVGIRPKKEQKVEPKAEAKPEEPKEAPKKAPKSKKAK